MPCYFLIKNLNFQKIFSKSWILILFFWSFQAFSAAGDSCTNDSGCGSTEVCNEGQCRQRCSSHALCPASARHCIRTGPGAEQPDVCKNCPCLHGIMVPLSSSQTEIAKCLHFSEGDGGQQFALARANNRCPTGEVRNDCGVCTSSSCREDQVLDSDGTTCICPVGEAEQNGICCPYGQIKDSSGNCQACAANEIVVSGACSPCTADGQGPNADRTSCEPCTGGKIENNNVCECRADQEPDTTTSPATCKCPSGQSESNGKCCPNGQVNRGGSCVQPAGTCPDGQVRNRADTCVDKPILHECSSTCDGRHICIEGQCVQLCEFSYTKRLKENSWRPPNDRLRDLYCRNPDEKCFYSHAQEWQYNMTKPPYPDPDQFLSEESGTLGYCVSDTDQGSLPVMRAVCRDHCGDEDPVCNNLTTTDPSTNINNIKNQQHDEVYGSSDSIGLPGGEKTAGPFTTVKRRSFQWTGGSNPWVGSAGVRITCTQCGDENLPHWKDDHVNVFAGYFQGKSCVPRSTCTVDPASAKGKYTILYRFACEEAGCNRSSWADENNKCHSISQGWNSGARGNKNRFKWGVYFHKGYKGYGGDSEKNNAWDAKKFFENTTNVEADIKESVAHNALQSVTKDENYPFRVCKDSDGVRNGIRTDDKHINVEGHSQCKKICWLNSDSKATEIVSDRCVPVCPPGQERHGDGFLHPELDHCVDICELPEERDADGQCGCPNNPSGIAQEPCVDGTTKQCRPVCPGGQTRSSNQCSDRVCACPPGANWNAAAKQCETPVAPIPAPQPQAFPCVLGVRDARSPSTCKGEPPSGVLFNSLNVHGDSAYRSVYSVGRADRPDYICYKASSSSSQKDTIHLTGLCPSKSSCRTGQTCPCVTNDGVTPIAGTYCNYARQDPLRVNHQSDFQLSGASADAQDVQIMSVNVTVTPFH